MHGMDTEHTLLKKAQNGDPAAFEALIKNYEKLIYNIAYRFFNNKEDARDISQETLIKIYKNLNKCQNPSGFKNWAATIATNTCIDESRRRKGKTTESIESFYNSDNGSHELPLPSRDARPDEALIQKETHSEIKAALSQLTDEHKALIILRDIYGFSYDEISAHQGIKLGTVKSGISRARNSLKKLLRTEQKSKSPVIHK